MKAYTRYQDATCMKSTIPAHPTDFNMFNMHCFLFRPHLSTPMTLVLMYHRRKGNSTRYNTPMIPKA